MENIAYIWLKIEKNSVYLVIKTENKNIFYSGGWCVQSRRMNYLPLFIETRGQRIVVVGTGQMAEAKCRTVLKTRAQITLVTAHPTEAMQAWADAGQLTLIRRSCSPVDLEGARLVYAAEESDSINEQVASWAREKGAWVNVLDTPETL